MSNLKIVSLLSLLFIFFTHPHRIFKDEFCHICNFNIVCVHKKRPLLSHWTECNSTAAKCNVVERGLFAPPLA